MSILTCDNISYAIGVKEILSDVTFAVNQGSKVGVIGVNGAGKSTLFSLLRGALDPTGGAIYFYNPAKSTSKWIFSRPVVLTIGEHVFAK